MWIHLHCLPCVFNERVNWTNVISFPSVSIVWSDLVEDLGSPIRYLGRKPFGPNGSSGSAHPAQLAGTCYIGHMLLSETIHICSPECWLLQGEKERRNHSLSLCWFSLSKSVFFFICLEVYTGSRYKFNQWSNLNKSFAEIADLQWRPYWKLGRDENAFAEGYWSP